YEAGDGGVVFRRMCDCDIFFTDLLGQTGTPFVPVAAPAPGSNAQYLEGIPIATGTPSDGQALIYNAAAGKWELGTPGGATIRSFTGAIDGVNTIFTLPSAPAAANLLVF